MITAAREGSGCGACQKTDRSFPQVRNHGERAGYWIMGLLKVPLSVFFWCQKHTFSYTCSVFMHILCMHKFPQTHTQVHRHMCIHGIGFPDIFGCRQLLYSWCTVGLSDTDRNSPPICYETQTFILHPQNTCSENGWRQKKEEKKTLWYPQKKYIGNVISK